MERNKSQARNDLNNENAWAMVESSPDGMILADEDGVILLVNSQIESLFGYGRSDLLGRFVEVLLPERFHQAHIAHRTGYRSEPKSRAMGTGQDLLAVRKDGSEFPVEVSLSPINANGSLRVVATVRDITDRLALEAHSHAVLSAINATHDSVFMFPSDTLQFSYVNQGAVTQLGYSLEELLEMSPLNINPEFTETSFREMLAPLLAEETDSLVFTAIHRRKDGSDVPVEVVLECSPNDNPNESRLLVSLVRDITDRIESEKRLRQSETAKRILKYREDLASDLHDLVIQRLFATGMSLQSVQSLIHDPQVDLRVSEAVTQLDQTIADLRSAIFNLTSTKESVADTISEVIVQAKPSLGFAPSLNFVGDPEKISGTVLEQLVPVLTEALSNIVKHAQASTVQITITTEDKSIQAQVTDNGIGFDPEESNGRGLINMESRANRVNGCLEVTSSSENGTKLTWTAEM